MISAKSQTKIEKNKRQELTQILVSSLEKMTANQQTIFLTGYICSYIGVHPKLENIKFIQKDIHDLLQKVIQKLISFTNFVEIIVEAIENFKAGKINEDKDILAKFQIRIYDLCGEIVCSQRFLREKWFRQSKIQSESKSLIEMEEESYAHQGKMEEEQSIKLIMKMQEEERIEMEKRRAQMDAESEKYLKQLLKEEQERDRKRKQMLQKMQSQNMTCQICLEEIKYIDAGTLSCSHIFHKACIRSHIQALVKDKKIDIPCPTGCGVNLSLADIEQYIDGDLKQKFQKFCFDIYVEKNDKSVSWCPSPGCTAAFTVEGGLDNYKCPVCHKHYCLACRCEYHRGMSCAQYRINNSYGDDDKKFEEFVRGAKFKQCPKCKYWVERVEGCSTMSCRCGHQFCYDCGGSDCPHGMCKNKPAHGGGGGILNIFGRRGRRR